VEAALDKAAPNSAESKGFFRVLINSMTAPTIP
jgi:hypothetical protein